MRGKRRAQFVCGGKQNKIEKEKKRFERKGKKSIPILARVLEFDENPI